jgi:transmembrane sensor
MKNDEVLILLEKYNEGLCTTEERAAVETWYNAYAIKNNTEAIDEDLEQEMSVIWQNIRGNKAQVSSVRSNFSHWFAIAATIVVLLTGLLLFTHNPKDLPQNVSLRAKAIKPGVYGATLTLANGKRIKLKEVAQGQLADEAGIRIVKTADGEIAYQENDAKNESNHINTLSTSRGETYLVVLPDQSKVWMNAASSLTYTTNLVKDGLRMVELSGEAYFEIAKDKRHPFIVTTKNQQVKVLGTHFNINAYDDEPAVKTTLLEGSVEINKHLILKPNEQAILGDKNIKVIPVIAESFIDWQQGVFNFEDEDLQSIMRKIARWYDVDVMYSGTNNDMQTFSGSLSRSTDIQKVLQNLSEISSLKFKVQNRTITVSK